MRSLRRGEFAAPENQNADDDGQNGQNASEANDL
jgi:hypothetical protein